MLIVGAKGFAKEVLEILHQLNETRNLVFYDDVNNNTPDLLFNCFPVIKNIDAAVEYLKNIDNRFTLGIGNPISRKNLADKFNNIGGEFTSTISPDSKIGNFGSVINLGCNIMSGAIISNDVHISIGCIVYFNSIITHDCYIDKFVEISPGAKILGRTKIGSYSQIGCNAVILPDLTIGHNVVVAAGSVVTKNIPDNCMVAGVPAIIKKQLNPLEF
jgi:sugar O-acyltransferase (sialic acid O-acetyltransferase NeuD family)